jgi:hypothetical protein
VKQWELAGYMLLDMTCNECVHATLWPSEVWQDCNYRLARREAFAKGYFLPPKDHPICEDFLPIVGLEEDQRCAE